MPIKPAPVMAAQNEACVHSDSLCTEDYKDVWKVYCTTALLISMQQQQQITNPAGMHAADLHACLIPPAPCRSHLPLAEIAECQETTRCCETSSLLYNPCCRDTLVTSKASAAPQPASDKNPDP
jgi:hypothetical protein